ncbi:prothoracicotropic hormone [Anabrus simplex]|uniref:prothoracicotropic hormone n=1 Tax=Anabrus simplex TaxID=316456 RepID=UPI0034DDA0CA
MRPVPTSRKMSPSAKTVWIVLVMLQMAVNLDGVGLQAVPLLPWENDVGECEDSEDGQSQCVAKRQMVGMGVDPLPCFCEAEPHYKDLGPQYYPRYLPYVRCKASSCWIPPYQCVQRTYKVHVLKRRGLAFTEEDKTLPADLRRDWHFEKLNVVVGCECSLQY